MPNPFACVITTIQSPTPSVRTLAARLAQANAELIVVGDRKGPSAFDLSSDPNTALWFLPLAEQRDLPFRLARILPEGHYARKNLGYLLAFLHRAACIYETDDDNAPNEFWAPRSLNTSARLVNGAGWHNVYRLFTDENIWPRGLPLDAVNAPPPPVTGLAHDLRCPIQQGLADLSPDVDAVWRLVMDREITFDRGDSVWLGPEQWCPFNSQTTWWWPEAYPLMYLPSRCSFRMTDIWRSFIAQRCLWAMGLGLVFHAAEAVQQRNTHSLQQDFEQEIAGYVGNRKIAAALEALELTPGFTAVGANLLLCYEKLVEKGYFPDEELDLVRAWLADVEQATAAPIVEVTRAVVPREDAH